jgi:WD40 repeat protein
VFVTGESGFDYGTIAYKAGTGAVVWTKRYNGPGNYYDAASAVVVSPDGATVFVTGASDGSPSDDRIQAEDYATVAYRAGTGAVMWTKRYNGPASSSDDANAAAVSPDGTTVFVTGQSLGRTGYYDYATVAYKAATGAVVWTKRYNGPASRDDQAYAVAVSPDSTKVLVTGVSDGSTSGEDYATIAYSAT